MWKIDTRSFRFWKEGWERMAEKALERFEGVVSVGKVSMGLGVVERRLVAIAFRFSGLRARRARAKLPWVGEASIRAMPAPWGWLVVD